MNKLSALYKVGKQLKTCRPCEGTMNLEVLLDTTVLGTMRSEMKVGVEKSEKKTEIQFGEELFKLEHSGKSLGGNCCVENHSGMGLHGFKRMHYNHGQCCTGPLRKLDHALFMLKVLDQTVYQENADGSGVFTLQLTVADLPEDIQSMINSKCCGTFGHSSFEDCCPEHGKAWLKSCGCLDIDHQSIEPVSLNISMTVDEGFAVSTFQGTLLGTAKDKSGEAHHITVNVTGQCK